MSWGNYFKKSGSYLFDRACDGLIAGFEWTGHIAAWGSGILSAGSLSINEAVEAGYYASGVINVLFNVNVTLINFSESFLMDFNYTKPVSRQGRLGEDLEDGIDPFTLQMYALIALLSGMALNTIATIIGLYINSKREQKSYQEEKGITIQPPSWAEYKYAVARANLGLLTSAFTTHSVALSIFKYSSLFKKKRQFSYPSNSDTSVCTSDYCGPVKNETETFTDDVEISTHVNIFGTNEPVHIGTLINGSANGEVGAGVTLEQSHAPSCLTIPIAAAAATMTGLGYSFFNEKAKKAYSERLINAGKDYGGDLETKWLI